MSKADVLVNISKKYYKEVKQRILLAEEDREYGRYKKYGGKIKFKMYLARLYGMNEVCEALMEVLEMSKADEMFEKLGYKKLNKKEIKKCFVETYDLVECCYRAPMCVWVVFYKDRSFDIVSSKNTQELQAINEKVKELRLDRRRR